MHKLKLKASILQKHRCELKKVSALISINVKNVFLHFLFLPRFFVRFNVFLFCQRFLFFLKKRSSKFENSTENVEKGFIATQTN